MLFNNERIGFNDNCFYECLPCIAKFSKQLFIFKSKLLFSANHSMNKSRQIKGELS